MEFDNQSRSTIDSSPAAKTGDQPTLTVAIEQNFPEEQRIIDDALAPELYAGANRFWIQITKIPVIRNWLVGLTERFLAGGWSCFLLRKRYIDEHLLRAVSKKEVEAVVNLGAGFDTRFYRFESLRDIPCWEVDQPITIDAKEEALSRAINPMPENVTLTRINFVGQNVAEQMQQSGYEEGVRTFFIWEAVSQYLDEAAVADVFNFFSKAPAGSQLAFTYVVKDFIEGANLFNQKMFYKRVVLKDKLWHFGFDPDELNAFLSNHGWKLIEDLGYAELDERFVKPTGRILSVMEFERIVYAEKIDR